MLTRKTSQKKKKKVSTIDNFCLKFKQEKYIFKQNFNVQNVVSNRRFYSKIIKNSRIDVSETFFFVITL